MRVLQKQVARKFVGYWTFPRGNEKGEDQQSWNSLLGEVLDMDDITSRVQHQVPASRPTARTTGTTGVSPVDSTFAYNDRSEILSAAIGTKLFTHAYDDIGNQLLFADNAVTNTYTHNNLNQITTSLCPPASPRTIHHNADGGLSSDGIWSYAYDAEDQLRSVTSRSLTNGAIRVRNTYDHRRRRISKTVQRLNVTTASPPAPPVELREWETCEERTFVYDDWNLIHETIYTIEGGVTNTSEVQYFWGFDLSGTLQGAGGVGGLLAVSRNGQFYFPSFDNNGNITKYIDESGNIVAAYEYDDFGRIISQSGPLADFFRHRFSTKYYDPETGLYYYGHRYYSPDWCIWLNRDPIGESGGINLYQVAQNNAITAVDALGLEKMSLSYDFATDNSWFDKVINWSTISVLSVEAAKNDILNRVKPYGITGLGKCNCIQHIILAGHGHEGAISFGDGNRDTLTGMYLRMARSSATTSRYFPKEIVSLLSAIKSRACREMTIEFATCLSGRGTAGRDLRDELQTFFGTGTTVILYDREVKFYFNTVH